MKLHIISCFLFLAFFSISCQNGAEQTEPERRKSPIAIAKVDHQGTYIKIVYGQPYKLGRTIFGELVPYNEVWRTGANEATELTTTSNIMFAGKRVEAGTYALFTIPQKEKWTIILNSDLGQWGAFDYNSDFDILRVDVDAHTTEEVTEAFIIQFGEVEDDSTSISMKWDSTQVNIPIKFTDQSATN